MASSWSGPSDLQPLPKKIQRLEEAVVNRIAAGEVIQRPANAIKEMLENSLDAGSTSIQVTVKSGGMKLLQIQDNGCGIKKEDMAIVCERFTTSKLRKFEDLSNIATYGFRGEALASISHVAHVTITTKTADSKCAYKAAYSDGKLIPLRAGAAAEPKACAGNQGTVIVVEDLFYNITTRRKALKSPADEYAKIADVMTKYAVHNSAVAFTLKKHGDVVADVRTHGKSSVKDNISLLFGSSVGREILCVSCENKQLGFKMEGQITNANYSVKKLQFLLFINHRLVDSSSLRKAVEVVYNAYLPKNTHPFVYMSIEISPSNVDVNVHPTKHEVHFLHEDKIVEAVQKAVEERLLGCNASRTYFTQALLPGAAVPVSLGEGERGERQRKETDKAGQQQQSTYAYQMVRTDSREQKLDAFLVPKSLKEQQLPLQSMDVIEGASGDYRSLSGGQGERLKEGVESMEVVEGGGGGSGSVPGVSGRKRAAAVSLEQPFKRKMRRKEVTLTSVRSLQQSVRAKMHKDLMELFQNHIFVGCVDQARALVQFQTKLYLVDVSRVTRELFYQLALFDFSNFGILKLTPPAPIYDLAMLALNSPASGWSESDGPKEKLAQYIVEFLVSKAPMLKDYFSFEIDPEGRILTLPMLLQSHSPNLDRLPLFLVRLATEVEWETEKECFQTFAQECGNFYCTQHDPFLLDSAEEGETTTMAGGSSSSAESKGTLSSATASAAASSSSANSGAINPTLYKKEPWRWIMEHVIFPALKTDFIPQRKMAEDGTVLQIADLHELYKVFERC